VYFPNQYAGSCSRVVKYACLKFWKKLTSFCKIKAI